MYPLILLGKIQLNLMYILALEFGSILGGFPVKYREICGAINFKNNNCSVVILRFNILDHK